MLIKRGNTGRKPGRYGINGNEGGVREERVKSALCSRTGEMKSEKRP